MADDEVIDESDHGGTLPPANTLPVQKTIGQKAGLIGAIVVVIAFGAFVFIKNNDNTLTGAKSRTFPEQTYSNGKRAIIGAYQAQTTERVNIKAVTTAEITTPYQDSEATLLRIAGLEELIAEQKLGLVKFSGENKLLNGQIDLFEDQIRSLEKNMKGFNKLANERLKQEQALLKSRYETLITSLKGQLAIAKSNQVIVDNTDELKRLAEQRALLRRQIESNAVIFDNSEEDTATIRY